MKRIYLDYAASTPLRSEVISAMQPYWQEQFANTGAIHQEGAAAAAAVLAARIACARFVHARRSDDIIFTSGATEANNLGFFGPIFAQLNSGKRPEELHVITTPIEHRSILDAAKAVAEKGVQVTYLHVDEEGLVHPNDLREALRSETILVSIGMVNSEVGTVQPIHECARVVDAFRRKNEAAYPYMHTDATQAPVYFSCNVDSLGVDMMSLGGQKVYGPKGVGLLYAGESVELAPLMYGGTRERGLRPGTLPTPLLVGFAKALELAEQNREHEVVRVTELRDTFIKRVEELIPEAHLNGSREHRTPNNANFSFPGLDNEFLVLQLDNKGVACSAKSACSKAGGSHVVAAMGKGSDYADSAIRFSLGKDTTLDEILYAADMLAQAVEKDKKVEEVWL